MVVLARLAHLQGLAERGYVVRVCMGHNFVGGKTKVKVLCDDVPDVVPPPLRCITMDVLEALESSDEYTCYMPSWGVLKFLILQLFPNIGNSTSKDKKTTKREIAEHYNRGNDFFRSFLGKPMIYTSGVFEKDSDDLCSAQDNKMRKVSYEIRQKQGKNKTTTKTRRQKQDDKNKTKNETNTKQIRN